MPDSHSHYQTRVCLSPLCSRRVCGHVCACSYGGPDGNCIGPRCDEYVTTYNSERTHTARHRDF